jgi:F-type H+-transporting ATPase subunit a
MELPTLTNDINTIIPLALLMSIAYFYARLSKKRLGYFDKYIQSTSILLPVNILEARAQMLIIYINMCEHFFGLILNYKVYFIYIYIYIYIYII